MLTPSVMTPSDLYSVKPPSLRVRETRATWDGSMAYIEIAVGPASIFTFYTSSLIESTIFFKITPWSRRARNILVLVY